MRHSFRGGRGYPQSEFLKPVVLHFEEEAMSLSIFDYVIELFWCCRWVSPSMLFTTISAVLRRHFNAVTLVTILP